MTQIIRAVKANWTPQPGPSLDPRVHVAPDHYRFTQNQIESEQRQSQRNFNRTVRAGRQSQPSQGKAVSTPFGTGVVPVLPIGVSR